MSSKEKDHIYLQKLIDLHKNSSDYEEAMSLATSLIILKQTIAYNPSFSILPHHTIDENFLYEIAKREQSLGKIKSKSNLKQKALPLIEKKVFISGTIFILFRC